MPSVARRAGCNWPCNCHSPPPHLPPSSPRSPTTHVKHRGRAQHSRQDHLMGIHAMLMALFLHKLSAPVNEPIHKHTGLRCLDCRLAGRQTDRQRGSGDTEGDRKMKTASCAGARTGGDRRTDQIDTMHQIKCAVPLDWAQNSNKRANSILPSDVSFYFA